MLSGRDLRKNTICWVRDSTCWLILYILSSKDLDFTGEVQFEFDWGKMSVFFIKLADKSSNVLLQAILGTYGHLMWVRTEVPQEMIVKVISTPELASETRRVLEALRGEIEFEFVDPPQGGDLLEG